MYDLMRIILVAATCLITCLNVLSHELQGPKLVCSTPVFDFGTTDSYRAVRHTFLLQNTGDQTLHLDAVRACCGTDINLRTNSVPSGGKTELDVILSLKWVRGKIEKKIFLKSDDPTNQLFQLTITGNVESHVSVSPPFIDFGALGKNVSCETNIILKFSEAEKPSHVTGVVSTISNSSVECRVLDEGSTYSINIKVTQLSYGVTKGLLQVSTDNPKCPIIEISVLASVFKDIVVVPGELVLVPSRGKESQQRKILLRSRSGKSFAVQGINLPDDHMRSEISSNTFGGSQITLNYIIPESNLEGKNIIIHTDDKESPNVLIPIHILD